jgi:hypothetical protein
VTKKSTFPPFFGKEFGSFKMFEFPGVDMDTLLSSYQKNMELMDVSRKITTEATQSLITIQNKYIQKFMGQWNERMKNGFSKVPCEETTAHQAETAKTADNEMLQHLRNTHSIIQQSNKKIIESIQNHFKKTR